MAEHVPHERALVTVLSNIDLVSTSPYYSQMDPQAPQAFNGQNHRLDK